MRTCHVQQEARRRDVIHGLRKLSRIQIREFTQKLKIILGDASLLQRSGIAANQTCLILAL